MEPPKNFEIGLANSQKRRSENARLFSEMAFVRMMAICDWDDARTLQEIAACLNAYGYRTRRGALWTPGPVQKVLRSHGTTAKQLHQRMRAPSPYEQTAAQARFDRWPLKTHNAYYDAERLLIEDNGDWVSALTYEPRKEPGRTRIRHAVHGEGQMWRVISISRYLCSFIDWSEENTGSYEVECTASELEVWCYKLPPEERERLRQRLRSRFFSQDRSGAHRGGA